MRSWVCLQVFSEKQGRYPICATVRLYVRGYDITHPICATVRLYVRGYDRPLSELHGWTQGRIPYDIGATQRGKKEGQTLQATPSSLGGMSLNGKLLKSPSIEGSTTLSWRRFRPNVCVVVDVHVPMRFNCFTSFQSCRSSSAHQYKELPDDNHNVSEIKIKRWQ